MTLDDGKQGLVHTEEHRLVGMRVQVVQRHRLQRSEDHDHMMRVGDKPLPLAQQRRHRGESRYSEGEG